MDRQTLRDWVRRHSVSGLAGLLVRRGAVAQAKYLGAVVGATGQPLNVRHVAVRAPPDATDAGAPVHPLLGTAVEVGKTTGGLSLLRTLLGTGYVDVCVLKATGATPVGEAEIYSDVGATRVSDWLEFGIPTTFPSGRQDAAAIFDQALDVCLSSRARAILIECGGNFLRTSVPEFLQCLMARRSDFTTLLAASDSFGAVGGTRALKDMGVRVDLITGPSTDTPAARQRTEAMCGVPARNMRTPFQG